MTFYGSGKSSKRKLTLTTPDVARQVNTKELPREQDMYLTEHVHLTEEVKD